MFGSFICIQLFCGFHHIESSPDGLIHFNRINRTAVINGEIASNIGEIFGAQRLNDQMNKMRGLCMCICAVHVSERVCVAVLDKLSAPESVSHRL